MEQGGQLCTEDIKKGGASQVILSKHDYATESQQEEQGLNTWAVLEKCFLNCFSFPFTNNTYFLEKMRKEADNNIYNNKNNKIK